MTVLTQNINTVAPSELSPSPTKKATIPTTLKEIIDIERNPRKNKKIMINLTGKL